MKKPKICALIAVRMKSKRLPRKALVDINGYTSIERLVNNLKASKYLDEIVLATSTNKEDDDIEFLAKNKNLNIFRGDEDNVVQRFIDAAEKFNAEIIVRVTGDCPLISFEIMDYLINEHLKSNADYTSIKSGTLPIGISSEIINLSTLKELTNTNVNLNYSEYMTFYFLNNPSIFSINLIPCQIKEYTRPNYRITLDYPEDLEFFNVLYENIATNNEPIPLIKIINFLDKHPEIVSINNDLPLKWKKDQKLIKKLKKETLIGLN